MSRDVFDPTSISSPSRLAQEPRRTARTWSDLGIDVRGGTSGQVKTRCPKCGPTRRNQRDLSLSVNLDVGIYRCHNDSCGFQGRLDNDRERRDVPRTQRRSEKATRTYVKPAPPSAPASLRPQARQFFRNRMIDPDIAEELGVYANDRDAAIAFPYWRNGETVHVKYRSITEKRFWSSKDTEPILYNLDGCKGAVDVVIVEGELDALSLMTLGIDTVLSVPNGAFGPGQNADGKLA